MKDRERTELDDLQDIQRFINRVVCFIVVVLGVVLLVFALVVL